MIFLIPARAGSKRLPGKNKRPFCGIPLYMWSVATARRCSDDLCILSDIVVSTDDVEILRECELAEERDARLSHDTARVSELVKSYMAYDENDAVCLLQPTSPTRRDSTVKRILNRFYKRRRSYRSVTKGIPNGQIYIYCKGFSDFVDVETECGHDINDIDDFNSAERYMMRRFK